MDRLDTTAIILEAREKRAEEMRRIQGLVASRLGTYFGLLIDSAAAAGNNLQPLFSWNPQDVSQRRPATGPGLAARANELLRSLFSWNPQAHRS